MNYLISVVEGECFNNTARLIIEQLSRVEFCLECESQLEVEAKNHLEQALSMIPRMFEHLAQASLYQSKNFLRMSVERIVLLGRVEQKVQAIQARVCSPHVHPIKRKICLLDGLERERVSLQAGTQTLISNVMDAYRLPFGSFEMLRDYYYSVENSLNGETRHLYQAKVKLIELFHLLADRFDEEEVEEAGLTRFCGSYELHATISYSHILSQLLTVPGVRKGVVQFLLDRVNQAKHIALKTTYINLMEKNKSIDSRQAYFSDLLKLFDDERDLACDTFQKTYQLLPNDCLVPAEVVLGDVCHDLVKMVETLQAGDKRIFCAGTASHEVLIEIECDDEQAFFYTIYNTGEGGEIDLEMSTEFDHERFMPITYGHLKREIFTYHFFEALLGYSFDQTATMEAFYLFHFEQLIEQATGTLDYSYVPLIRLQKFEICTYAVLDEWINSHLEETEIFEKERLKVRSALRKQTEIIHFISSRQLKKQSSSRRGVKEKRKKLCKLDKVLKFKALCKNYQRHLKKNQKINLANNEMDRET